MIKEIKVYETNGKRFDTLADAENYDYLCNKVNEVMSRLEKRTDDVEHERAYLKHNITVLNTTLSDFCNICKEVFYGWDRAVEICEKTSEGTAHFSHMARLLSDNSHKYPILHDAMFRFCCTDFNTGFEFSQPYYASHPEEFFEHIEYLKNYR